MSWLSSLFGGGGGEDPYAVMMRNQAQARIDADNAAQKAKQEEDQRNQEFQQQMLMLQQMLNPPAPPPTPVDPGTKALQDAKNAADLKALQDQQIAADQQKQREGLRSGATASVNTLFQPEFESVYAPSSLTAPLVGSTYQAQRDKADAYLKNMLARGVITQAGFQGGEAALEEQAPKVRSQLSDISDLLLKQERGNLTDIGNRARSAASTLDIGQTFDPSLYTKEAAQSSQDFAKNLSDKFASQIPGDLFDLSSIPARAGAAQGAQNLPFDPSALGQNLPSTTDETDPNTGKPVQKRTATVF